MFDQIVERIKVQSPKTLETFLPPQQAQALQKVRWPGRFSRFGHKRFCCRAFVSGDHNEQGIKSLIEILQELQRAYPFKTLHPVVGFGKDKSIDTMFRLLFDAFPPGPKVIYYLTETVFKTLPLKQQNQSRLVRGF